MDNPQEDVFFTPCSHLYKAVMYNVISLIK